jgi:hypothetical protein
MVVSVQCGCWDSGTQSPEFMVKNNDIVAEEVASTMRISPMGDAAMEVAVEVTEAILTVLFSQYIYAFQAFC